MNFADFGAYGDPANIRNAAHALASRARDLEVQAESVSTRVSGLVFRGPRATRLARDVAERVGRLRAARAQLDALSQELLMAATAAEAARAAALRELLEREEQA